MVVPVALRAVTADAGTEGEVEVAHLWTLAEGKVTSLRIYVDAERAIRAMRLGERGKGGVAFSAPP